LDGFAWSIIDANLGWGSVLDSFRAVAVHVVSRFKIDREGVY
jgi:hypothetical protein